MIVSIDSKTEGGQNILDCMQKNQDGWLRAEWVARENYAPTVQLEKAEEEAKSWRTIAMNHLDARDQAESKVAELKKLSSHNNGEILLGWMDAHRKAMDRVEVLEGQLAMIGQIESHKRVPDYVDAVEMYSNYDNPSASAKASALDDTPKAH